MKKIKELLQEIDWKDFRRTMMPYNSDMDVEKSLWGRKIRAIRPFLLFSVGIFFTIQGLES